MWVIVFNAVDDFGIKEANDIARNHNLELGPPQIPTHMDEVKARVFDEALRGASRIAGLVRFLIIPLQYLFTKTFHLDRRSGIEPISGLCCCPTEHETLC